MNGSELRRTNTTKGTPLRILSLDGGGVRGYSMLILLHDFMHKTYSEVHGEPPEPDQVPKPCDYFDLIAGTGTGGLIAIMLGRLRMNTKDCMRVYVQMTRKVFETDKTIIGIPYRSTLFKASMLEDAIRACVRSFENKDGDEDMAGSPSTLNFGSRSQSVLSDRNGMPRRSSTTLSVRSRHNRFSSDSYPIFGDPNAPLEDLRKEKRCKTAVTAVLKGQNERSGTTVLLRSYPSRTQPAVESEVAIWQAGRATCATKLAFKEIRIGTSTFLDEGYGLINSDKSPTYNPAPQVLDEAIMNEWPGQSVGLFLSIGTGKRPGGTTNMQSEWWEGFAGGLGSFAEAKRKLIAKIEGCEKTHKEMQSIHLPKRGISPENYLRLNVEVGVGEFGMNEWNRLAEISNNTQSYLSTRAVKVMLSNGAKEMARVDAIRRQQAEKIKIANNSYQQNMPRYTPPAQPTAIELPSEDVPAHPRPLSRPGPLYPGPPGPRPHLYAQASHDDKFAIVSSDEYSQPADDLSQLRLSEKGQYRSSSENPRPDSLPHNPLPTDRQAPPLPPKTPIRHSAHFVTRRDTSDQSRYSNVPHTAPPTAPPLLPYPDTDGPPPAVNMARKPEFVQR